MSGAAAPASVRDGAFRHQGRLARASSLLFAALVLSTFLAFFLAQHLKHIPTAVQDLKFDQAFYPEGGGVPRSEPISFQIERSDYVTVRILNGRGDRIATLLSDRPLRAYTQLKVQWGGGEGAQGSSSALSSPARPGGSASSSVRLAPEGEYRVQVLLLRRHIEIRSPSSFRLVRVGR